VYDANGIATYCPRTAFANGFFIDQSSVEVDSLDAEYSSQLADRTLNASERQRLLDEYRLKRSSLELGYTVSWARPDACSAVSEALQRKIVNDVLLKWADESQNQRDVLNSAVVTLSPAVLDSAGEGQVARLVRIDQIRRILNQSLATAAKLQEQPGADQVRLAAAGNISLPEVKARMNELLQTRLDPLLIEAGAGLGVESLRWAEAALGNAETQQRQAESRSQAYAAAIREFGQSASARSSTAARDGARTGPDPSGPVVQVDRAFLDRMLELSKESVQYRQRLTQSMVLESLKASEFESEVSYYRRLVGSLRGGRSSLTPAAVDQHVDAIVKQGKTLIGQLRDLANEFSRVAFRAGPNLYELGSPVRLTVDQAYSFRSMMLTILLTPLTVFVTVIAGLLFVTWARMRMPRLR